MKGFSDLVDDATRGVRVLVTYPEEGEVEFIKHVKFQKESRMKLSLIDLKIISKWFMTRTSFNYTIADPQDFCVLNYRLTNISEKFRKELLRKIRVDYLDEDHLIDEVLNMTEEELLIQLFNHSDTSKSVEKCVESINFYYADGVFNELLIKKTSE